jgi:hypothetical protein
MDLMISRQLWWYPIRNPPISQFSAGIFQAADDLPDLDAESG